MLLYCGEYYTLALPHGETVSYPRIGGGKEGIVRIPKRRPRDRRLSRVLFMAEPLEGRLLLSNQVGNGDFEQGKVTWNVSGAADIAALSYPHLGSYYGYLGNTNWAIGNIHQTVDIPSNATSATLSFYLNVSSVEPGTGTNDVMDVNFRSTSDVLLKKWASYSEANKTTAGTYSLKTFDVSGYIGQTVILQFYADLSLNNITVFRIDDVSLIANVPSTPTAPSNLGSIWQTNPNKIVLGWDDNSNNETGFVIERKTAATNWAFYDSVGANSTNAAYYTDTNVAAGTAYSYRVYARNASGNSGYSNEVSNTVPLVLTAPSSLVATPHGSYISLSWADNSNNEEGFTVEWKDTVNGAYQEIDRVGANVTTYKDSFGGLQPGVTNYYRVRAYSGSVFSAYSTEGTAALPTTVPSAPTLSSPGTGPSPGQALTATTPTFQWQLMGNVDKYGLYISRLQSDGTYQLVFDSQARGVAISGETNSYDLPANILATGNQYRWNLNAHNINGWGAYSTRLYFTITTANVPNPPTGLTPTATGPTSVSLDWDDATGATGYKLYRSASSSGPWTTAIYFGNASQFTDDNGQLSPDATYYYRVSTVNGAGESALSSSASVRTPTQNKPPNPTNLRTTVNGPSSVTVSWDDVLTQGQYVLERFESPTGNWVPIATLAAGQNAFIDTTHAHSTPQTIYTYRVRSLLGGVLSDIGQAVQATLNDLYQQAQTIASNITSFATSSRDNVARVYKWNSIEPDSSHPQLWTELSNLATIDWSKPTIILTHGWNDRLHFSYDSNDPSAYSQDFLNVFGSDFMRGRQNSLGSYNLLAVDWYDSGSVLGSNPNNLSIAQDFLTSNLGPLADANISAANGVMAAKPLAAKLVAAGIQPGKVALIGHSNGAGFMASLATSLKRLTGTNVDQLESLDAPYLTASYWEVLDSAAAFNHVDNYYIPLTESVSGKIWKPFRFDEFFGMGAPMFFESNVTNFELNNGIPAYDMFENQVFAIDHTKAALRFAATADAEGATPNPWGFKVSPFATNGAKVFDGGLIWTEKLGGGFNVILTPTEVFTGVRDQAVAITAKVVDKVSDVATSVWDATVSGTQVVVNGVNSFVQKATDVVVAPFRWIYGLAHSPVLASIDVQVPANATFLSFDCNVQNAGNSDKLQVAVGQNVIGEVDLASQKLNGGTVQFWVGSYSGQKTTLSFYLPSDVASTAEFTIGNVVFGSVSPPTADIVDVSPDPRNSGVDSVTIAFSKPIIGFDLSDLTLSRNGSANLLSGTEGLSSSDGQNWTLTGLSGITGALGTYVLTLRAAGSGILDPVNESLTTDATDSFSVVQPPASVESIAINDGSAQRSMVTSLSVVFNVAAGQTLSFDPGAFELTGASGVNIASSNPSGDGKTFLLKFSGSGIIGGSLPDGIYGLTVHANLIHDNFGQTLSGGNSVLPFHRLFGDSDGDKDVDGIDALRFRQAQSSFSTSANYRWYLDFEGDGDIDGIDSLRFRQRQGQVFSY